MCNDTTHGAVAWRCADVAPHRPESRRLLAHSPYAIRASVASEQTTRLNHASPFDAIKPKLKPPPTSSSSLPLFSPKG
jgi:hypothetical protein